MPPAEPFSTALAQINRAYALAHAPQSAEAIPPLYDPIAILDRIDTRGRLLRAIDTARADFIADGGDMDDHAILTEMGEACALFVEKMQGLARQRSNAQTPEHSHSWLRDVIAGEVIAEHYRLDACAARVLTAAAEGK